jgi:hypothetical protein
MLFKSCGEVGDRRITQEHRNFRNAQSFFIEQVFGMFHPLALVKIENGSAKHFLESFFQVTFIDGNFAASVL